MYQKAKKSKVEDLLLHNRVDFIELADYTEGGGLDKTVMDIICKMAMTDSLVNHTKVQRESIIRS